jgi:hypothetical protein
MSNFVLLSKEHNTKIELSIQKLADKRLRIVTGAALIPDLVIPRKYYNIIFSKDTIRKISENFMINNYKDTISIQHKVSVNKVNLVESWIVDNKSKDKSSALGLNVPNGTWMVSLKINDEELWSEYLSSGVLKGFSIEGNFTEQEVKMHQHNEYCKHSYVELSEEDKEVYDLYLSMNFTPADLETYYMWKLGDNENNCPSCLQFNQKVKKLADWIEIAIPAHRNGDPVGSTGLSYVSPYGGDKYGTYCEHFCNCTLEKVQTVVKRNIINPFDKWKKK